MSWQTTWTKAQRERSKSRRETLFAVGFDGPSGRGEQTGMMAHAKVVFLFNFARMIYSGKGITEAFKATKAMITPEGLAAAEGGPDAP
jgi:hypothetical protein